MTDMTNEPSGVEPNEAPTTPLPVDDVTPTAASAEPGGAPAEYAQPVYVAPAEPVPAPASDHVSVSKRTLWIVGGVVLALVLLGGVFAFGVGVGSHAQRFDRRGPAIYGERGMQQFGAPGGQGGGQGFQRGGRGSGRQGAPRGMMPGSPQGQDLQQQAPNSQNSSPTQ